MNTATFCLALLLTGAGEGPKTYPRPELLVEVETLAKPEAAKQFIILDARSAEKYAGGFIPRAVPVDHEDWSKTFAKTQDPKIWAKKIGALGIHNAAKLLVYEWILRYFGHKDVRLLNGGFKAWQDAKMPVSTDRIVSPDADYVIAPDRRRFATAEDVLKILKEKKVQIIDARSEKEFCGEAKLKNKRGGAIPGAMHLEWTEALDKKSGKFKGAAQLADIFKNAGIDVAKPSVTYCQSGARAAVMAFTLELMGAKDVANYYRSWSEWGNREDTPIVTPRNKVKE
jgi:thiosulfate/3-mercaptopyruvate sulfurtransferase